MVKDTLDTVSWWVGDPGTSCRVTRSVSGHLRLPVALGRASRNTTDGLGGLASPERAQAGGILPADPGHEGGAIMVLRWSDHVYRLHGCRKRPGLES